MSYQDKHNAGPDGQRRTQITLLSKHHLIYQGLQNVSSHWIPAQIWQKRNYLQLTDEEAETQLGLQVHKSQNLRAINHQNCILDQELLNLSCRVFFTVHKLTIVFRFLSGYISQYIASQSIKPKVFSIWLLVQKKKFAIPALDHCHHHF